MTKTRNSFKIAIVRIELVIGWIKTETDRDGTTVWNNGKRNGKCDSV